MIAVVNFWIILLDEATLRSLDKDSLTESLDPYSLVWRDSTYSRDILNTNFYVSETLWRLPEHSLLCSKRALFHRLHSDVVDAITVLAQNFHFRGGNAL